MFYDRNQHMFMTIVLGYDPNMDSPVEILHTVLLGVQKYAWSMACSEVSQANMSLWQARLESVSIDGMSIDPIAAEYIIQYRRSLIGRQLKAISQTVAFTLHGLVSDKMRTMWVAAGHMISMLWYPEIDDIDSYCVST